MITLFTTEQLHFLESNFVSYDPDTRESSTDFSPLLSSRVVLMGELHGSQILQKVQNQFFQLFANDSICCLAESFPPHVKLSKELFSHWPSFPSSGVILGADNREIPEDLDRLEKRKKLFLLSNLLHKQFYEVNSQISASVFAYLNEQLAKKEITLDASRNVLLMSTDHICRVGALTLTLPDRLSSLFEQLEKTKKSYDALNKPTQSVDLQISNSGLGEIASTVCSHYTKVVAIWGNAHFILGQDVVCPLRERNVSFTILIPNPKLEARVRMELRQARKTEKPYCLRLSDINKPEIVQTLYIYPPCTDQFAPQIQEISTPKNQKTFLSLTPHTINEMLKQGSRFKIPPNLKVRVPFVSSEDLIFITDKKFPPPFLEKKIIDWLSLPFLFAGVRAQISLPGRVQVGTKHHSANADLQIISSAEWWIEVSRSPLVVCFKDLMKGMKLRKLGSMEITSGQSLILNDMLPADWENISVATMARWMNSKCHQNYHVVLNGDVEYLYDQKQVLLQITSQKGFSLNLSKL